MEIPERLLRGAHRRGELLAAGIPAGELRGPLWEQSFPRRWAWAATDPTHPRQRALAGAAVAPDDGAVGGWAAAYLLGATQLDGSTPDPDELQPVLLCMPRVRQRPWHDGVRPFRSDLDAGDVVEVDGVPVTSPLRTAFDLARRARTVTEAVVRLDVMARDLDVSPSDVWAYAEERRRWRGLPLVRAACPLVDPRAASPQETRFRMLWMHEAGLPRPLCNWPVHDLDGHLLGVVDLLDPEAALAGEYDGSDHAAPERRALDHARQEQIEAHRLKVVRTAGPDLTRHRLRTVQRLQARHRRGRARDRNRDLWLPGTHDPV
jgi:hypothetical protein